jgi:formylmethanofuran dehydrogenase subunit E
MPDSVLFRVQEVEVSLSEFDLPGPTRRKVSCDSCGQMVRDHREVVVDGSALCHPCAHGGYYKNANEITWPDMNWTPVSSRQEVADSRQQKAACEQQIELGEAERRGNGDAAR